MNLFKTDEAFTRRIVLLALQEEALSPKMTTNPSLCLLTINSLTVSQEPRLPRRLVKSFAMPKTKLQGKILSTICSISKSAMTQLRLRALKKLNKSQCLRKRHELSLA